MSEEGQKDHWVPQSHSSEHAYESFQGKLIIFITQIMIIQMLNACKILTLQPFNSTLIRDWLFCLDFLFFWKESICRVLSWRKSEWRASSSVNEWRNHEGYQADSLGWNADPIETNGNNPTSSSSHGRRVNLTTLPYQFASVLFWRDLLLVIQSSYPFWLGSLCWDCWQGCQLEPIVMIRAVYLIHDHGAPPQGNEQISLAHCT